MIKGEKNSPMLLQFVPGDWVLYSRKDTPQEGSKKDFQWIGPYQVLEVSGDNVYKIHSFTGKSYEVHGSRLWFYSTNEDFIPTEELRIHFEDSVKVFDVKKILKHRIIDNHVEYLLWWKGFKKNEATWEKYSDVIEQIPAMIETFNQNLPVNRR